MRILVLALVMLLMSSCQRTILAWEQDPECWGWGVTVERADGSVWRTASGEPTYWFMCECLGTDADYGSWDDGSCITGVVEEDG